MVKVRIKDEHKEKIINISQKHTEQIVSKGWALLNLILPGIGTLIAGGKSKKVGGIIQVCLCLIAVGLDAQFIFFISWIWAFVDMIIILFRKD